MIFSQHFEQIFVPCCDAYFAVPEQVVREWKRTQRKWACPYCGMTRWFVGKTDEQKRIEALQRRNERMQQEVIHERERAQRVSNQYSRMRKRIQNGVCPCCNRTFQNLARHMASEHPDTDRPDLLRHMRAHLGMTQADLAHEIGLEPNYISRFETGRSLSEDGANVINAWLDVQMEDS